MGYEVTPRSAAPRAVRVGSWAIAVVLLVDLALLPFTAHAYDAMAFLSHADRIFFGHVDPVVLWPFGVLALLAVVDSQLPVLAFPGLWNAMPLRLFLLKLPQWFADLGSAAVVRALATERARADVWALRYLLDPAVLFVTVVHGQNDALPAFLALAGIALTIGERYELAAFALGLGAGTKFFPAAYLPLLLVVTLRRGGFPRALAAAGIFAVTAAAAFAPVAWGRFGSVVAIYSNNSFGAQGTQVSSASLWTLLPPGALRPQIEQLVAVLVPIVLAALELRHRSSRIDVARAAALSAIAIVLLNPGVHPPFYLWMAGPIVLYAAVAGNGAVSAAGAVLTLLCPLTQFCQEGSDEYFLLAFGPGPLLHTMPCVAPSGVLQGVALAAAIGVAVAGIVPSRTIAGRAWSIAGNAVAGVAYAALVVAVSVNTAFAARYHGMKDEGYRTQRRAVNTFAVNPVVAGSGDECALTYVASDLIAYAGNPYAARFATASLGYTLFSPQTVVIRGTPYPVAAFANEYENDDLRPVDQRPMRVTQEFDVTAALRPFRYVERFRARPCPLIRDNPLLIYRFDLAAAQAAAAALPLLRRLDVFVKEPSPAASIKGRYHA